MPPAASSLLLLLLFTLLPKSAISTEAETPLTPPPSPPPPTTTTLSASSSGMVEEDSSEDATEYHDTEYPNDSPHSSFMRRHYDIGHRYPGIWIHNDPIGSSTCSGDMIQCRSNSRCIRIRYICDGDNDCGDNSDEDGGLCMVWNNYPCERGRINCRLFGDCISFTDYCQREDPQCVGNLDSRVCVMLKDNKLKPLHKITLPATTTTTTTPPPTTPPPTTLLPFTNQTRQEMEERIEHFEHKLSLTISHPDCPELYTRVGNLCLSMFFMGTMDWLEARTFCRAIGGHLLTLGQDAAAYAALLQHLASSGVTNDFWVGGRRNFNETGWQWLDDTPVQMGSPYWAVRYEAHCKPRTLPDPENQTILANDGACYHYQQAPPGSTHRHCLAATFRHYWHLSDEDCGDKKSPLCARQEELKEEKKQAI